MCIFNVYHITIVFSLLLDKREDVSPFQMRRARVNKRSNSPHVQNKEEQIIFDKTIRELTWQINQC